MTCLTIATILMSVCQMAPRPEAAVCHTRYYPESVHYCHIDDPHELPIYTSLYDPGLCDAYPTNCAGDPATTATGHRWQYGDGTVACPPGWLGRDLFVAGREFVCRDTGGRIHPMYREYWDWQAGEFDSGWVIMIDVLLEVETTVTALVQAEGWLMVPHWSWE